MIFEILVLGSIAGLALHQAGIHSDIQWVRRIQDTHHDRLTALEPEEVDYDDEEEETTEDDVVQGETMGNYRAGGAEVEYGVEAVPSAGEQPQVGVNQAPAP